MTDSFNVTEDNKDMFFMFCEMHPHEAFEMNPAYFQMHMNNKGIYLDLEEIRQLLKETEL